MGNIVNYVEQYGDKSFSEKKVTSVDSLVFSQFSYLKFDGLVPGVQEKGKVKLSELRNLSDFDKLFSDERHAKDNKKLFEAMEKSVRFRDIELCDYVNKYDADWTVQFSAVRVILDTGVSYIIFRGTDETIVGWKEDFNMSFMTPVKAQEEAVSYLSEVVSHFDGKFYVGGHSKGGNLAIYGSMMNGRTITDRVIKIYCHDSPGFVQSVFDSEEYNEVVDRIEKLVPHSSIVGMLFQTKEDYDVVDSKHLGFNQHDPFNWIVEGEDFVRLEEIKDMTKFGDDVVNDWIEAMTDKEREQFVDYVFGLIEGAGISEVSDVKDDFWGTVKGFMHSLGNVDKESKEQFKILIRKFKEQLKENFLDAAKAKLPKIGGKDETVNCE